MSKLYGLCLNMFDKTVNPHFMEYLAIINTKDTGNV